MFLVTLRNIRIVSFARRKISKPRSLYELLKTTRLQNFLHYSIKIYPAGSFFSVFVLIFFPGKATGKYLFQLQIISKQPKP